MVHEVDTMSEKWIAYTDGSCMKNPDGEGGWAYVILTPSKCPIKASGYSPKTTNQRMELMAIIQALRMIPEKESVIVYSDSRYACDGISSWMYNWARRNWVKADGKPVLNLDLWKVIYDLTRTRDVTLYWVQGHADTELNNECDRMAREISIFAKTIRK